MKEMLRRHIITVAFVVLMLLVLLNRVDDDAEIHQLSGYTMGTTFQLQFVGIPEGSSQAGLQREIESLLMRLDKELFSTYEPESELSRFNAAPIGQPFDVSPEMAEVVALAQEVSRQTAGAFDVTVGPLVNAWGFGPDIQPDRVPEPAVLQAALERVGHAHLLVDSETRTLVRQRDIYADLSGIAKGYAVDRVADYFESVGVQDYFLEIGGELKIRGEKPGGSFWVPAVERPVDTAPQAYEILSSRGEELAIAGSGDYRNYFEQDGVRYSHEIDPRTGWPIAHNLAAVYVIDSSTARADALATAFMVLGYDAGYRLATDLEQAVYFIVRDASGNFAARYTEQFGRYIEREE